MIALFDWLNPATRDLYYSLKTAGFTGLGVVVNDDGCLPEGITSPYSFFCGMEEGSTSPRYFNQVVVPDFWQITGTNTQGEIWNFSEKKANIYYHEPKHLRLVKDVDWLTNTQKVYRTDHYNQYGWLYAKSYMNEEEQVIYKKYYRVSGQEVVVENLQMGLIFLYWKGKVYTFESRSDFFLFYFKEAGLDTSAIWYNSLSTPFVISYYLNEEGEDILFWQEKIGDHVPGNMRLILSGSAKRTKKIIVQDKDSYDKLLQLLSLEEQQKVSYLGYIYPSQSENHNQKDILILTNSDQLEGLETLVSQLHDFRFHIAALTEMSQRLTSYGDVPHVTLYPNVAPRQVEKLLQICDIYLDINHGSEILSAVRQAFEHNLLIAGFKNTLHNPSFVLREATFSSEEPEKLANWLRAQSYLKDLVKRQRNESGQELVESYRDLLS
ncbi:MULTISPECIES: accessory Sec system glycosylation chaperone GtfB [unclassified Streptococcus]|uniref:accessory Sec system glycosylation chaperone GtfB n=1 Tax=unclassified Streptococcus TaxID=2608887 RepID=UPI0010721E08|nr:MULTISPECIES: accessory Sec system glycosylation chaperone GtfB [unclassified Streptococcus]MBF0787138.1 accessory Sec system glycosylation chaperone GtfB [Streptococcus sp. 19428wC2_LYSM12]MCQ9212145.1 accessory Sec system glycosylation chaperone GtfB [Streptococcus sp. B01]MCQ9213474.1 accessory Sec system glycosylation chaperone GtfB [Streptococcus sp. O1]TFV05896.1 accessory Sec system glycosylation chaperone GtfB [Streptococcus sp. LYSM12]